MTAPTPWVAPSTLAADFARLGQEVADVLAAGADIVHLDVMDNHYVPNLSVGPLALTALRRYGIRAPIDVHLMVRPVERLIDEFLAAGADVVSFHPEASERPRDALARIRAGGAKAGLALNPGTPVSALEPLLDVVDWVLVMAVNPGFGGQEFMPESLVKVAAARRLIDASGRPIRLQIDGGIKVANVAAAGAAGADVFVAGSAIFGAPPGGGPRAEDYRGVIAAMRAALGQQGGEQLERAPRATPGQRGAKQPERAP